MMNYINGLRLVFLAQFFTAASSLIFLPCLISFSLGKRFGKPHYPSSVFSPLQIADAGFYLQQATRSFLRAGVANVVKGSGHFTVFSLLTAHR